MNTKALAFDTGGTAFNQHDSLVKTFTAIGTHRESNVDWDEATNDWQSPVT